MCGEDYITLAVKNLRSASDMFLGGSYEEDIIREVSEKLTKEFSVNEEELARARYTREHRKRIV